MFGKLKLNSLLRGVAAGMSVVTLCIAPVAEGAAAANQKKLINQYLKETGLTTKKLTVGEFWRRVRHVYPAKLQKQMDQWVALNSHELMPKIEATSFKDGSGNEQIRLVMTKDGQSYNVTFTGDEENPVKLNGISINKKELSDYNNFNGLAKKVATKDPVVAKALKTGKQSPLSKNFALTYKEFVKLTPEQKAEYLIRARRAIESAQRVFTVIYGEQAMNELNSENKYEWVLKFLFGENAYAAGTLVGKSCIVAGYLTVYGESGSCGGSITGGQDLRAKMAASNASCASGSVACNPLVYGYTEGGKAYCVGRGEVKFATRVCNNFSPLKNSDPKIEAENKKRIVESFLKNKGQNIDLQLNEEGKISEEQYKQIETHLKDLQDYVNSAISECDSVPLKDIQKIRNDQAVACAEIKDRAFSLQSFKVNPEPNPNASSDGNAPNPPATCADDGQGEEGADGNCQCPEGQKEVEGICHIIETTGEGDLPAGKPERAEAKDDSCGFWCRNKHWILPVGVGLLTFGLLWWMTKSNTSKAKTPTYVPPAPVPDPDSTSDTTTPDPVVPPPPPPVDEGGAKVDTGGKAGGVR